LVESQREAKLLAFEKGKGRGYTPKPMKPRHFILKQND